MGTCLLFLNYQKRGVLDTIKAFWKCSYWDEGSKKIAAAK